jgi:hypothetical protein
MEDFQIFNLEPRGRSTSILGKKKKTNYLSKRILNIDGSVKKKVQKSKNSKSYFCKPWT